MMAGSSVCSDVEELKQHGFIVVKLLYTVGAPLRSRDQHQRLGTNYIRYACPAVSRQAFPRSVETLSRTAAEGHRPRWQAL